MLKSERGVVRVDGFAPFMMAGLGWLLLGPPDRDDDAHRLMGFIDPAHPFHEEGLGEDFPDDVLERLGADAEHDVWMFWRLPDALLQSIARHTDEELAALAERWKACRVVWFHRGSSDFTLRRPALHEVLRRLREVSAQPRPFGAWIGWDGEG